MYREAIKCEALRADVFAGKMSPVVFGQPEEWLALLIESMLVHGRSRPAEAQSLRARAFESAPTTTGSLDNQPFEWIADADMRLGPVCEAVINGRYYWVPFERLARIDIEAPVDLRDVVWMPAHFEFANGGEAVGVIPTRYPGSETADEAVLAVVDQRQGVLEAKTTGARYHRGTILLRGDIRSSPLFHKLVPSMKFALSAKIYCTECIIQGVICLSSSRNPEPQPGLRERKKQQTRRHIAGVTAPLLILHGRKDKRVVPLMTERMVEALEIEGKTHEVHWYDDEGHGWERRENRRDAFERILRFLRTHLLEDAPEPGSGNP